MSVRKLKRELKFIYVLTMVLFEFLFYFLNVRNRGVENDVIEKEEH